MTFSTASELKFLWPCGFTRVSRGFVFCRHRAFLSSVTPTLENFGLYALMRSGPPPVPTARVHYKCGLRGSRRSVGLYGLVAPNIPLDEFSRLLVPSGPYRSPLQGFVTASDRSLPPLYPLFPYFVSFLACHSFFFPPPFFWISSYFPPLETPF